MGIRTVGNEFGGQYNLHRAKGEPLLHDSFRQLLEKTGKPLFCKGSDRHRCQKPCHFHVSPHRNNHYSSLLARYSLSQLPGTAGLLSLFWFCPMLHALSALLSPSRLSAGTAIRLALLALAVASFGIGTTEFVIVGLLPSVAADLGVSIPRAGLLVSGYALGVTFGSPFLAIATARMDRRQALLLLMGVFIIGNLACAIAPDFWLLMAARVLTSLCHGAFFGLGAVVAAQMVQPGRKAQAIAMMFAGLTLANVLGVPLGTMIGETWHWRTTFLAVVLIGLLAALALFLWLPRGLPIAPMRLSQEVKAVARTQVILAMSISILVSASLFTVFTYITPLLTTRIGISAHGVTVMLLIFGAGLTVGNFAGGWLADRRLMLSLIGIICVLTTLLLLLPATTTAMVPAAISLFIWGVLAFAVVAPLQTRVVNEATQAPNLASTLNQGAFNLGNAAGAGLGGAALTAGFQYGELPWLAAGLCVLALMLTLFSWLLERKTAHKTAAHGGASS